MAITTTDGLITALATSPRPFGIIKTPPASLASAGMFSTWTWDGIPGKAADPSSGAAGDIPTDATAGAFPFTNPTSPALTYLSNWSIGLTNIAGSFYLYDRLWQNSGLSPTSLTGQTVNSVALNRPDANGDGAEAWFQVYATMGASTTAPTITYTNSAGTGSRTGTLQSFVTAAATSRVFPFSMAAGDVGVKSIQTYTNAATMTSGTFGLVLQRRIAALHTIVGNSGVAADPFMLALPRIYDDACLTILYLSSAAGTPIMSGDIDIAQG